MFTHAFHIFRKDLRALRFPEFTGDPMNFTLPLRP